jgi:hypothetical protein
MAYTQDIRVAARRHLRAAQVLHEHAGLGDRPGCIAVAGYLFGIAGELAVKQLMRDSGIKPRGPTERSDDPFYAHFPSLKKMLATAQGRRSGELRRFSEDPRMFQNWEIAIRYAPTVEVKETWVRAWRGSAEELIRRMELG